MTTATPISNAPRAAENATDCANPLLCCGRCAARLTVAGERVASVTAASPNPGDRRDDRGHESDAAVRADAGVGGP